MAICLIGVGGNEENSADAISRAIEILSDDPSLENVIASHLITTPPIGGPVGQPEFQNAAIRFETELTPTKVLDKLQEIEKQFGRKRNERWGPRTIDLDLLLHGDSVVRWSYLEVPHPRMTFRRFVVEPCFEIAPELRHPTLGWTIAQLFKHLVDAQEYIAIAGPDPTIRREIAEKVMGELVFGNFHYSDPLLFIDESPKIPSLLPYPSFITAFWYEQELVTAAPDLAMKMEHNKDILTPKLLIVLEEKGKPTDLRDLAIKTKRCPFLCVDQANPDWAVKEVVAAFQAMR